MPLPTRRALSTVTVLAVGATLGLWPVSGPPTEPTEPAATVEIVSTAAAPLLNPVVSVAGLNGREVHGLAEERGWAGRALPTVRQRTQRGVPARSGQGRRVIFDEGAQRVWLVRANGTVLRTYPVSGSRHDNLDPGRYEVYSTSRHATSYTYRETMDYMVRFTHGERATIGFHDIPVDTDGQPVQTHRQLGTPLSAGCIRQAARDAKVLWDFAPVGTRVVVIR